MNLAEDKRNARISATPDVELLGRVLTSGELSEAEVHAFADMRAGLVDPGGTVPSRLSRKQRSWLEEVARRVLPVDAKEVPRGKEVDVPEVLKNLPKKPPGRG